MMKKIEHIYLYTCLTIIVGGFVIFLYWLFWPVNVIKLTGPVTTDKTSYHPGDRISYTISYCKYIDLGAVVVRSLVNGTRTNFTTQNSDIPMGCHTTKLSDLIIPDYLDSDKYHLEANITYQVNPIRTVQINWRSNDFKIIRLEKLK